MALLIIGLAVACVVYSFVPGLLGIIVFLLMEMALDVKALRSCASDIYTTVNQPIEFVGSEEQDSQALVRAFLQKHTTTTFSTDDGLTKQ